MKLLANLRFMAREVLDNRQRISRLAWHDFMVQTTSTKFGFLWQILTPAFQIGTYWFVFTVGLRSGRPIDGVPYILWLIAGIVPWFLYSKAIINGSNSIYSNSYIFQRIKFPVGIIPIYSLLSAFLSHAIELAIVLAILLAFGFFPGFFAFQLLYYAFASFAFLLSLSYITSAVAMLSRDFQKLLQSVIRFLFFLTPIIWPPDNIPAAIDPFLKLNPLYYLVQGYRDTLLYRVPLTGHPLYAAYFWVLILVLFLFGITVHMRFRRNFVDML